MQLRQCREGPERGVRGSVENTSQPSGSSSAGGQVRAFRKIWEVVYPAARVVSRRTAGEEVCGRHLVVGLGSLLVSRAES